MECRECKWIDISNYVFEDGTKTIICEKYSKHLGFTDKNGEIKEIKFIGECQGIDKKVPIKIVARLENEIFYDDNIKQWIVSVNDAGRKAVIAIVDNEIHANDILCMFNQRKSYLPHIHWNRKRERWVVKLYNRQTRKYTHIIQTKYYSEAIKRLKKERPNVDKESRKSFNGINGNSNQYKK